MIRQLSTHSKGTQNSGPKLTVPYVAHMIPMLEKLRGKEKILDLFNDSEFISSIDSRAAQKLVQKIIPTLETDEVRKLLVNLTLFEKLTPVEVSGLVLSIIKNEDPHITYDFLIDPRIGTALTPETFNLLISYVEKGNVISQICGLLTTDTIRSQLSGEKISALLNRVKIDADLETTFEVISTLLNDHKVVLSFDETKQFLTIFFKKIIATEEIALIESFALKVAKIIAEQGTIEQKRGAYGAFCSAYKKSNFDSIRAILIESLEIVRDSTQLLG